MLKSHIRISLPVMRRLWTSRLTPLRESRIFSHEYDVTELYFDGHAMQLITRKDRLGSYRYEKQGSGADALKKASAVLQARYRNIERVLVSRIEERQ